MFASGFSIFGSGGSVRADNSTNSDGAPTLKLRTDKDVYRPGDPVVVTVEICNVVRHVECSVLIERLSFEIKGLQKFDTQWFATQKQVPGSKQRRGEHFFMDGLVPTMVSNEIISAGTTKSYMVRTVMPNVIPPSYKGSTIRYLYYVRSKLSGKWLKSENGHSRKESVKDHLEMEARVPLQVWVSQKNNGFVEDQDDGTVPSTAIPMDIFWKEIDGDSDWVRGNDIYNGTEEGYESSRDEVSSVSSYNPMKESFSRNFGSSLSLQSYAPRSTMKDNAYLDGGRAIFSSNVTLPWLTVAEVSYDTGTDNLSSQQQKLVKRISAEGDTGISPSRGTGAAEPVTSEGFIRGRSYNIRLDDQVLLRFSPKNSNSLYYFSDMIGGTLTFFHEGARRCLEVSITLETSETIGRDFVHPSRRNSPTITKVQSDYHEVVADLVQTSFLFSIPMDGPMSFSTPHVSVQWSLRFEFFTTPKNVDWTRYEHPLLIEGREKSEWVLPIIVHAPSSGTTPASHTRGDERPFSLEPLWANNG